MRSNRIVYNFNAPKMELALRLVWTIVWMVFFRLSPIPMHGWRVFLLRIFGAKIGSQVRIYPSVSVWFPWNLRIGKGSCLGRWVNCYSVDVIELGESVLISQYSYLCSAGHDIDDKNFKLKKAPIKIKNNVWVAADAFIGPGVTIGDGAVVGARAAVFKNVKPWTVVGGNPAKLIRKRKHFLK